MERYDAIVVGGGVMGCAAAYHLASDGRRVLLLERFSIPHAHGSSHGPSRIIRLAYGEAFYISLARAAYAFWRELEDASGERLLTTTGGLDFARRGAASLEHATDAMVAVGVAFEELACETLRERFPQFDFPEDTRAVYQAEAGVLDADRCVLALLGEARRAGAVLRGGEGVRRLVPVGLDGAEVTTERATYGAERLIVAAGPWTRGLARQLGLDLPLTVTKEQVAYFEPVDGRAFAPGRFPVFVEHDGTPRRTSGFPEMGSGGVKLMQENKTVPDDGGGVDAPRIDALAAHAGRLLPGLTGRVLKSETCRYTMTPDEDFILDRHPEYPQITLASPCSGHGFKFGSLFGHVLADLASTGRSAFNISRFGLNRPALAPGEGVA